MSVPSPAQVARLTPSARRDQLGAVAARQIARHGVSGLSMAGVAREAGVTRALVYRYFRDRDELIRIVMRREAELLLAATNPVSGSSVGDYLRGALRAYLDHFAETLSQILGGAGAHDTFTEGIAAGVRATQADRLRQLLDSPDAVGASERLLSWLSLVETLAQGAVRHQDIAHDAVIEWSIDALTALFPGSLDLGRIID